VITKFLKSIFKSGKKAKKSVEDSLDFFDDVLEKEYITGSIDRAKEASGELVQKAGHIYQRTSDAIEKSIDTDKLKSDLRNISDKGKKMGEELSQTMLDQSATLKNVMNEGKEALDRFFEEE